tara:strand:+ start:1500 stop:1817 length:318 start_codon:yes stop_codon:yes gene_type:complete
MGYIGSSPAAQALTGADIQDGSILLADIAQSARDDLGNTDLYGFKKTNGTGNQLEDLVMTYTNGADDISTATNDGTQTDLYDESFFSKKGLSFSVNSDGELLVTV